MKTAHSTAAIADSVLVLADWESRNDATPGQQRALRQLLGLDSKFMGQLMARLKWAYHYWPAMRSRLLQAAGMADFEGLAQEFAMLLLTENLGGRSGFALLAGAITASRKQWSDAECLAYILGHERRYPLPRPGRSAGSCPTIWLLAVKRWRQQSKRKAFADQTLSNTRQMLHEADCTKVVGRRNGQPMHACARVKDAAGAGPVEDILAIIGSWPIPQQQLVSEAFGGAIIKIQALERLFGCESPPEAADFARCCNLSLVSRTFGCSRAQSGQLVREFLERLICLSGAHHGLSQEDVRLLCKSIVVGTFNSNCNNGYTT